MRGQSDSGFGVVGSSKSTVGVFGFSESLDAMYGFSLSGIGVYGESNRNDAVVGVGHDNDHAGVVGAHRGRGNGVYGENLSGGYAGYFYGDVHVRGTLSKGAGSFTIDHPLDPANKRLSHSFVESPDMMNIYNGNIITDGEGNATVTLPAYFRCLNREFRYQLTVIEQFAQAIVSHEIKENQFSIETDKPRVKVSWMVTGIRQDAYANAHRIPVEEVKPEEERGRYLNPELFGQPAENGVAQARFRGQPADHCGALSSMSGNEVLRRLGLGPQQQ
jgi:hypothetical protein